MKDSLKKYIQDHREEFDTLEVPEETFDKIMFRLHEKTVYEEKTIPLFPWRRMLLAASVVIIFSIGFYIVRNQDGDGKKIIAVQEKEKQNESLVDSVNPQKALKIVKIETDKPEKTDKVFVGNTPDSSKKMQEAKILIQNNHAENEDDFNKIKALELLNNQYSASSRLQGIALLKNFSASDRQLVGILSEKALSDESTNVRLAAVETLSEHIQDPEISRNIKQIFLQQDDAMVQKELIAILANQNSSELTSEVDAKLKELAVNPTTADFVKDEAYAVLMKY